MHRHGERRCAAGILNPAARSPTQDIRQTLLLGGIITVVEWSCEMWIVPN
jgi:hypothetical protein